MISVPIPIVDIVTVFHRDENYKLALDLETRLHEVEPFIPFQVIGVDNREDNRGFAKGCNLGAGEGEAPVIGFLNPDVAIDGPFLGKILNVLADGAVITGERFGKTRVEYKNVWGCDEWVCGAAFFVRRDFFDKMHGFDEQYVWSWEETDLIRRAQAHYPHSEPVRALSLPLRHSSPNVQPVEDANYKNHWFTEGARLFRQKWGP